MNKWKELYVYGFKLLRMIESCKIAKVDYYRVHKPHNESGD